MALPLLIAAAAAGAAAGGGLEWAGYSAQAKARNKLLENQQLLQQVYSNALNDDPLLAFALSTGVNSQTGFNRHELFRNASSQIDAAFRRRSGEMLQSLAGYGIEAGSAQAQFLEQRLSRERLRQMADVKTAINQAITQSSAESQMTSAGSAGSDILALKQLQIAGA
jgi:hypothetical protein